MSFRDILAYNVIHFPDKPALKSRGTVYTWADIDHGASVIASELYALGVRKRTHAAICSTNSVNWILTFWALQKLGAVAVLVNPALTAEEIIRLAHTGDIEYLCYGKMPAMSDSDSFLAEIMTRSQIRGAFDIRESVDFLGRPSVNAPDVWEVMPDDVCVMIFTSGSTGSPKGVLHSAYSLCKIQGMCTKITHINENDIDCMMMPMFHIAGMMNAVIESALFGALIILPESIKPEYLLKLIHEEKCTIFNPVPTVLLRMVNSPEFRPELVETLRLSALAGAHLSEAQVSMLMEKMPANHFMSAYGLSEIAPVTMPLYGDTAAHITQTVGKPIEGIDVKIQNPDTHEDCPAGTTAL